MKKTVYVILILIIILWLSAIATYFIPGYYPTPCHSGKYFPPSIEQGEMDWGCITVLDLRSPNPLHYYLTDLAILASIIGAVYIALKVIKRS